MSTWPADADIRVTPNALPPGLRVRCRACSVRCPALPHSPPELLTAPRTRAARSRSPSLDAARLGARAYALVDLDSNQGRPTDTNRVPPGPGLLLPFSGWAESKGRSATAENEQLGYQDSNLDRGLQRPQCCRYTIPHRDAKTTRPTPPHPVPAGVDRSIIT